MRFLSLVLLGAFTMWGADDAYLHWQMKQARSIALAARVSGKVGSSLAFRGLHTERSFNYKLRATWLTPEVIRACARIEQLTKGLSDQQTRRLVEDADAVKDTVFLVEIDPDEGSGIIPLTWSATLGPAVSKGATPRLAPGTSTPAASKLAALSGGARRDYDYDVFWLVFPLRTESGEPLFTPADHDAELTVQISGKVGKIHWTPIPPIH